MTGTSTPKAVLASAAVVDPVPPLVTARAVPLQLVLLTVSKADKSPRPIPAIKALPDLITKLFPSPAIKPLLVGGKEATSDNLTL